MPTTYTHSSRCCVTTSTLTKADRMMSAHELQEKTQIKKSTVQKRLNHLIELQIVKKRFNGPKTRYQILNRD